MTTDLASQPKSGSPADRGSADRYYGRWPRAHCYRDTEGRYVNMVRGIRCTDLTDEEMREYWRAYETEEERKQW